MDPSLIGRHEQPAAGDHEAVRVAVDLAAPDAFAARGVDRDDAVTSSEKDRRAGEDHREGVLVCDAPVEAALHPPGQAVDVQVDDAELLAKRGLLGVDRREALVETLDGHGRWLRARVGGLLCRGLAGGARIAVRVRVAVPARVAVLAFVLPLVPGLRLGSLPGRLLGDLRHRLQLQQLLGRLVELLQPLTDLALAALPIAALSGQPQVAAAVERGDVGVRRQVGRLRRDDHVVALEAGELVLLSGAVKADLAGLAGTVDQRVAGDQRVGAAAASRDAVEPLAGATVEDDGAVAGSRHVESGR